MKRLLLVLAACSSAPPRPTTPPADAVQAQLVAGSVTLVDFWAEYCGACITVAGHVAVAIANNDRIHVVKIDVGDGDNELARKYEIGALPHWKVYDKHKRLRYVLLGTEVLRAPKLADELLREP